MDRAQITDFLRAVPAQVDETLAGLSEDDLRRRPGDGDWSALEVCWHLRDYAEIEGQRVRLLVEEDEPAIEPWDEQERAAERDYANDDPRRAVTALRAFWGGLAYQLEGLSDEQWQRAGIHPQYGRVTVRSRAEAQVEHARNHIEQLKAIRAAL
jgi:hypothetical protein